MKFDLEVLKKKLEEGYEYNGIATQKKYNNIHGQIVKRVIMLYKDSAPFPIELDENRIDDVEKLLKSFGIDDKIEKLD